MTDEPNDEKPELRLSKLTTGDSGKGKSDRIIRELLDLKDIKIEGVFTLPDETEEEQLERAKRALLGHTADFLIEEPEDK